MEVKIENNSVEDQEIQEISEECEEPENVRTMRAIHQKIIISPSIHHLKAAIDFFNGEMENSMEHFLHIKDIYHFYCLVADMIIDESSLEVLIPSLNVFFERIIDLCYKWKCLLDHFERDQRFYNSIQMNIRKTIQRLDLLFAFNSRALNECIPLMLSSLIITLTTIGGLKSVIIVLKPITNVIFKQKNDLPLNTDEWKRLLNYINCLGKAWKGVNDTDISNDESFSQFIIFYLDLFLGNDLFLVHISDKAIKCLKSEKNIELDKLFIEFQYQVSRHLLTLIDMNSNLDDLSNLLIKAMTFFGISTLPRELMRHIIPHFAIKCNKDAEKVLKNISHLTEKSINEIIGTYLTDIIRHIFYSNVIKNRSFDDIQKVIQYLSEISKFDINYRIRVKSYELFNSFLMLWSENHTSTLEVIAFIQSKRFEGNNSNGSNKYQNLKYYFNKETELRDILKDFFLGFIHKFDSFILDNSVCLHEKVIAINSFVHFIRFMDKQSINTFKVKLFSTIKLIISDRFYSNKQMIKLSIDLMAVFVERVDETFLCSQLLTISALVLPLMHSDLWPKESSLIFKELIIKHKSNPLFQSSFKHLYFIPEMNELREVSEVLKPYITYRNREEDICERITLVVNNINHENSRVQEFSLQELKKLLERHQKLVYKKCHNTKEFDFDYFVNNIVTKLMLCLKSQNVNVLNLTSDCLSILGAIDPLKIDLEKVVICKEDVNEKFLNFNEEMFKIILIKHLYRIISTSTTTGDQYSATFALQEVVKIFMSDNDFNIDELPQELRDFCQLLLTQTRYTNKKNPSAISEVIKSEPVFGSVYMTYKDWLNNWITKLFRSFIFGYEKDTEDSEYEKITTFLSQCSTSSPFDAFDLDLAKALSNHSIKAKLLISCFQILIRNQSIAQFLLPYIVITALKNAKPDQRQMIVEEIKVIIEKLTTDEYIFNDEIGHLCSQTVFHIYDYFKVWHKNRLALHRKHCKTPRQLKAARLKDKEFKGVQFFLENISIKQLAQLAYNCNFFYRSLRYTEENLRLNENEFQKVIPFLQKIFIHLEEPDSVEGCNSKRNPNNPSLDELILTHEAMGQMQEALICCEKAIALNIDDFESQKKYLQISLETFDQSALVKAYASGLIVERPQWIPKLTPYIIEAIWRLGDWNSLEKMLNQYDVYALKSFGAGIGDLFNSMIKKSDLNHFEEKVQELRTALVNPLSAVAIDINGYVRGHKYIVSLHVLHDINLVYNKLITELNEDIYDIEVLKTNFNEVIDIWNQRIELVRNVIQYQEPILTAERTLFAILSKRCPDISLLIKKQLFKLWLKSTKTARKSGNIQRSYNCLLELDKIRESLLSESSNNYLTDIENCEAIIESAKIRWKKNDRFDAIQYLRNQIERNYLKILDKSYTKAVNSLSERFSLDEINEIRNSLSFGSSGSYSSGKILQNLNVVSDDNESPDEGFAKLQLLYAKFCDRSGVLDQNSLAILYRSVKVANPEWEASHYNLAMYCNKILNSYEESKRSNKAFSMGKPEEILEMKGRIVQSLVESLKYGVKHSHNSLSLMLNIWLDLGTDYQMIKSNSKNNMSAEETRKTIDKMNNAITSLVANVPLFIFFTSFAQLTGRVLHPYGAITKVLKRIIVKLIIAFPQQSMWLLMRSINSQNLNRKNVFKEILYSVTIEEPKLSKFINDILKFSKLMTNMCQKNSDIRGKQNPRIKEMSLSKDFSDLAKLFDKSTDFSQILLPFRLLVNVTLPKSFYEKDYNPFPSKDIYIKNIDDVIELLHSLQRPKKISIYGTDGKRYTILCKLGDDLRKDNCLIEFCNLLNRCFKRDADSRRRQLKVKTYLVISLTDSCGLIEWIPGLSPLRSLVENQYRLSRNDYDDVKETVTRNYPVPKTHLTALDRIKIFETDILPKFKPSVFGNWFASTYSDPLSWYFARQAYIRSSAVFSVVGYLLGLGDRHGENILIEELTGETVHVDLNCMFNKGEEFLVPEKVPFRLTHNMVHAMGVTEFEGTFRKACEHVLRVARDNHEALLSFVTPLRYDHLLEWSRTSSQIRSTSTEITIESAEKIVFNIDARLKGIPSRSHARNLPKGIPLSVEGQVDYIIKEATDINNLGVMYIGWTPYL